MTPATAEDTDYREKIAEAIRTDHPVRHCPNTCDVAAALREGYVYSAAHLLQDATETPALDTALNPERGIPKGPKGMPADWSEWCDYCVREAWYCLACGAYVYPDNMGRPETCGNCGREFGRDNDAS